MKYIEFINNTILETIKNDDNLVVFGQNIDAGSCLSGLTKGLKINEKINIINSTNSENSLCGFGFGLLIGGVNSILFMKQLDFLLLGVDHLVNTFNIIRNLDSLKNASFTIIPIIVDNGYQGPQSSLNNFSDFCSMARIKGFTLTNKIDSEVILKKELLKPGFRIICPSQRLFNKEISSPKELIFNDSENNIFQYSIGQDVTIVCFNLSFQYGEELMKRLEKENIFSSLFSVNSPISNNWDKIISSIKKTKKLVIFDDSKSINNNMNKMLTEILDQNHLEKKIIIKRKIDDNWLNPNSEIIEINYDELISEIR